MNAENVVPFPDNCPRLATCMQETRIALLEERVQENRAQLDRIEERGEKIDNKLYALRNWLLGAILSVAVAQVGVMVILVKELITASK